ncbi:hypothetical protein CMI47_11895 [Candidatus Pacearchaeota archaeon]|nr:hypothetical protein [Candidatus Pacearchaeota archaeon]|tara:strand:+ start:1483 stop:1767 length:285 start_codon:yes stop_codon:yes gene_type:complete
MGILNIIRKHKSKLYIAALVALPTVGSAAQGHGDRVIDYLFGDTEVKEVQPQNPRLQRHVPMPSEIPENGKIPNGLRRSPREELELLENRYRVV